MNDSYDCEVGNKSEYLLAYDKTLQQFQENPIIHWEAIWWIQRPLALWIVELIFAVISLVEALLVAYLSYKVYSTSINIYSIQSTNMQININSWISIKLYINRYQFNSINHYQSINMQININ